MKKHPILVWDLPTRIFHWLLVILMLATFVTGQLGGGLMNWHGRLGLAIVGLLAFRLIWGFIGSTHARFCNFLPGPRQVLAYLKGRWTGLGHNPLGALSVLGMVAIIGLQAVTGLFATDDIAFQGPLASLADAETSQGLSRIHRLNVTVIIAMVSLHLGAILFYTLAKKESLVLPMISGRKEVADLHAQPARGGGFLSFLAALALALGVVTLAAGILLPAPPPPAPPPAW